MKDAKGIRLFFSPGVEIASLERKGRQVNFEEATRRRAIPSTLEGLRGRPGGKVNLEKVEDRAWLAALVVGEGSPFAASVAKGARRIPVLEISMQDEEAIDRAAALMGVRKTAGYVSPATGRTNWRVEAVGVRAMEVIEKIRPFLTETKIK